MNDWWIYILIILAMVYLAYLRMKKARKVYRRLPDRELPKQWREILEQRVPFYQRLRSAEQKTFEFEIHVFLLNYPIRGIDTKVTDLDRILIAAGGVIPTFRLEKWHYRALDEVLLYPDKFKIPTTDKEANGLVGWGGMEGQLWLSRKALYKGFHDDSDLKNVAIHEFIHLMDMQDGIVDGIPEELMAEEDIPVWKNLVEEKMNVIGVPNDGIRDYARTNPIEFLAASGEFYFEDPDRMKKEHPKLYRFLDKIFNPNANWF